MAKSRDSDYLGHMLDAAPKAAGKVQGISRQAFAADENLCITLTHLIQIIGEAAYQLSQETRASMPEAPWEDIIGMRHRLVHAYFDINLDILWQTIEQDLPALIPVLEAMVPPEES